MTEVQLKAAEEERDTLKEDVANSEAGKDVLIKKAWETRDAAVKRKNNTEIELAKTRIDVMQINSQLMEAIQQKVELSQQLDQVQAADLFDFKINFILISVEARHGGVAGGSDEQEDEAGGGPGQGKVGQRQRQQRRDQREKEEQTVQLSQARADLTRHREPRT